MNIWKSLATLIAGALASVAGSLYFQVWATPTGVAILLIVILVIILILYVSGTFSKLQHLFGLCMRGRKTLIGILNDAGPVRDSINSSCIDSRIENKNPLNPADWKKEIEQTAQANSLKVRVKLITTRKNFVSYSAILNPYGGAYPEPNASRLETLDKILEYVNEGGLFINVADVPGYWAYNYRVHRIFATPPQTYLLGTKTPPFSSVPFMQKLGLEVYNVQNVTGLHSWEGEFEERYGLRGRQLVVDRVVVIEKNVDPIMQPKTLDNIRVTPVFLVTYGDGKCMVSLPPLDNTLNEQGNFMKQTLAKILLDIVCKKK